MQHSQCLSFLLKEKERYCLLECRCGAVHGSERRSMDRQNTLLCLVSKPDCLTWIYMVAIHRQKGDNRKWRDSQQVREKEFKKYLELCQCFVFASALINKCIHWFWHISLMLLLFCLFEANAWFNQWIIWKNFFNSPLSHFILAGLGPPKPLHTTLINPQDSDKVFPIIYFLFS